MWRNVMWKEDEERRGSLMLLIKHMLAFFFCLCFHITTTIIFFVQHVCWELPSLLDLTAVVGSAFAFAAVFLAPGFGRTAVILPVCPGKTLGR